MNIRYLPEQDSRVESGPVQFGDDWPGVFFRGDNALYCAMLLEHSLESLAADAFTLAVLRGLVRDLKSCDARMAVTDTGRAMLKDGA